MIMSSLGGRRGWSERPLPTHMDPRLTPFDSRQSPPWRPFLLRLALRFRLITLPSPVYGSDGVLVGD